MHTRTRDLNVIICMVEESTGKRWLPVVKCFSSTIQDYMDIQVPCSCMASSYCRRSLTIRPSLVFWGPWWLYIVPEVAHIFLAELNSAISRLHYAAFWIILTWKVSLNIYLSPPCWKMPSWRTSALFQNISISRCPANPIQWLIPPCNLSFFSALYSFTSTSHKYSSPSDLIGQSFFSDCFVLFFCFIFFSMAWNGDKSIQKK